MIMTMGEGPAETRRSLLNFYTMQIHKLAHNTKHCGNIHAQILHLYGEDCLKETCVLENLILKLKKRMEDSTALFFFFVP